MKRVVLLLALLCAVPQTARAQYPYELDTTREAVLTGAGLLMSAVSVRLDRGLAPLGVNEAMDLDPADVNGFDRMATSNWSPSAAKASDVLLYASVLAPYGLLLTEQGKKEPWTLGLMAFETQILNLGATLMLKSSVARTRPYAYDRTGVVPQEVIHKRDARRSFPSGHTSMSFASATFIGVVNEKLNPGASSNTWVWAGAMGVATTTGVLRVVAGKHFPTDVLAGAALGAFVGWLVPTLHEAEFDSEGGSKPLDFPIASVSFSF